MSLRAWLEGLGLADYVAAFEANHIDERILPTLTKDDLLDLGIASLGHRKVLLAAIEGLQAPAALAPPKAEGERRPVTVIFVDLTGYTALSRTLDPETLHSVIETYFAFADRIIEDYGGYIDKHVGDSVMAVFGAPVAHGNDVERAARASLDIVNGLGDLALPDGLTISAHAGLAYGEAVAAQTGSAAHAAYTVTGDVVNLAARLTSLAKAGQVAVSDAAQSHLATLFRLTSAGEAEVKGLATPVAYWFLDGMSPREPAAATNFAGRHAELLQLRAIAQSVLAGGPATHAHLRGEAGIGKSRLTEEVIGWASDTGFDTVSAGFLDFGVEQGRDATQRLALALYRSTDFPDAPHLHVHARDILGTAATPEDIALLTTLDPSARLAGQAAALAAMLAARGDEKPLLVVIEDMHWAGPQRSEMIAAMIRGAKSARCFFLTTSRPENDPAITGFPPILSPAATLEIGPLRQAEARAMAEGLAEVDAGLVDELVARSGGHPLFLEHLLRYSTEENAEQVPDSVRNVVLAGVDGLDAMARRVLQAASILGQRGSTEALAAVAGSQYDPAAIRNRYIVPVDAGEYRFTHALVRDAIYDTLIGPVRRNLHARAAAFFAGRDLPLHARHLALAGDPEAADAYRAAAAQAIDTAAFGLAAELSAAGLTLFAPPATTSDLALMQGRALFSLGQTHDAIAAFEGAVAASGDSVGRARAEIALASALRVVERSDDAFRLLAVAEAQLENTGASSDLADLWSLRGNLHFPRAEIAECRAAHEQALVFAEKSGSVDHIARALGGIGDAAYASGQLHRAIWAFDRCVELAEKHGRLAIVAANRNMKAISLIFAGPVAGLESEAEAAIAAARRIGHARAEVIACHAAMCLRLFNGKPADALPYFDRAQALSERIGARRFISENLAFLGEVLRQQGKTDEARGRLEEALTLSRETGLRYIGPLVLGYLARVCSDDPARRRALIEEGAALIADDRLAHNVLFFGMNAIECSLEDGDLAAARHHAATLEAGFRDDPLPFVDFLVARAEALIRHREGEDVTDALGQAADFGRHLGYLALLPELEGAAGAK
ncbi:MAG TPA: tetratricopeptide repeat protein [Albidovulum sp.]|uniref:adenylate/guanylate cyclase domain-containing protein n=1 Tax=Albidovulum sp. TaxID=1872424 RepID=UPI002BC1B07A|nr:tetratricopeptide repeat protein [Albidovulum sp.]